MVARQAFAEINWRCACLASARSELHLTPPSLKSKRILPSSDMAKFLGRLFSSHQKWILKAVHCVVVANRSRRQFRGFAWKAGDLMLISDWHFLIGSSVIFEQCLSREQILPFDLGLDAARNIGDHDCKQTGQSHDSILKSQQFVKMRVDNAGWLGVLEKLEWIAAWPPKCGKKPLSKGIPPQFLSRP